MVRCGQVRLCRGVGLAFTLGVLIVLGIGIGAAVFVYDRVRWALAGCGRLEDCTGLARTVDGACIACPNDKRTRP